MSEVVTQERISIYNSSDFYTPDQFPIRMTDEGLTSAIRELSQSLLSLGIVRFTSEFTGDANFINFPHLSICVAPGQYPIWNKITSVILQLVARYVESPDPESFACGGHGRFQLNTKTHEVKLDWTKLVKRDMSIHVLKI